MCNANIHSLTQLNQIGEQLCGKRRVRLKQIKKPSKNQEKETCQSLSSSSEEIHLDPSGDSFDEDNNDDFCAECKRYFYAKKDPKSLVDGITRRALFNVWKEEQDPKCKTDAVLSLVRSTTDFDKNENQQQLKFRKIVKNFCSFVGGKWMRCHRNEKFFSKTNDRAAVAEWYRYPTVACLVTSSSPVPLKTRRVGQRCTLNLSRAETSSRWCGVVVRRGGASSGVIHVT
ncbi:uncharacterized protein TNCV_1385511 [Trichonephila clavipes]|nr:uncharacterized protein TNCV_1385511 [Trichonephila clavipes]